MLLLSIFLLPLVGAVILTLVRVGHGLTYLKFISLFFTILTFLLSILTFIKFDSKNLDLQFVSYPISEFGIGVDGISLSFLLLTTFLFVICTIYNCRMNCATFKSYMTLFLVLESFVIGFFISINCLGFYIFFEAVLIPMFFIIGIWGGKQRIYAAFKFFLYTMVGSLLFLFGLLYIYSIFETFDMRKLVNLMPDLNFKAQILLWITFFISFAIKIPMFPFHTWLPDAHVQSPTTGSVILASLLIKMGGYGFLRFSIPMLPHASFYFSNFIIILSTVTVIYTSLIAFAQRDIKKLIAYSSVAHMGTVTAGLFSLYEEGMLGAVFQMISHAIISSALFLSIGILYTRTSSLEIKKYFGFANTMPRFSFMFILFSMASIGLPGTSGFIGEFLSLVGVFRNIGLLTGFILLSTILGAVYMLNLCKQIIWGVSNYKLVNNHLDYMELSALIPLAILVVLLGFYPNFVLDYLKPCTTNLLIKYSIL